MGVEERFGIEIPDQDAERLETVGAIHTYVWNKLETRQTIPCPNIVAFNQLRRSLVTTQRVERRRIAPSTPLAELLPANERRTRWVGLSGSLGRRLPALELPRPLATRFLRLNIGLACPLLVVSALEYLTGHTAWAVAGIITEIIFLWGTSRAAAALSVEFPDACATVGMTVKSVLQPGMVRSGPDEQLWTKQGAWEALKALVVEQLGVPAEHVTPDASLVDDLGAG